MFARPGIVSGEGKTASQNRHLEWIRQTSRLPGLYGQCILGYIVSDIEIVKMSRDE